MTGELATGSASYEGTGFIDVTDGMDVELIPGAQGGFHVWLSVRVRGVSGGYYLDREARRASDDELVFRGISVHMDIPAAAADAWWESPEATPAFMCPSPIGVKVFDEELVFDVRLTDNDGDTVAADRIRVTPRCPAGDLAAFCEQICSG